MAGMDPSAGNCAHHTVCEPVHRDQDKLCTPFPGSGCCHLHSLQLASAACQEGSHNAWTMKCMDHGMP